MQHSRRTKAGHQGSSGALAEEITRALEGDLSLASRIYSVQAISLDAIFTGMARRSGNNMDQYLDAADRYMRLALIEGLTGLPRSKTRPQLPFE